MNEARNFVVSTFTFALVLTVLFIVITQSDSITQAYNTLKIRNLISLLEEDIFAIGAISAATIGYLFIILKEINAGISDLEEDDKAKVVFSFYRVAYAELTIVLLVYISIVFSGDIIYLIIATPIISVAVTYANRNLSNISGYKFFLAFVFLMLTSQISVSVYPSRVVVHELIFFTATAFVVQYSEQHSKKDYNKKTTEYSFAEKRNNDDNIFDDLVEDRLSPEIVILLFVVLLGLVYILNFSAIIVIYILASVPALIMFVKFWSYVPEKYDIKTDDGVIEEVFINQERYSQGYLTILTEEGQKRILLHNVTEIKPSESDSKLA